MADIFISYSNEDRPKAGMLGAKLMEQGYSVWWDRNIILGQDYYDQIEAELEASQAVVVLWSKTSVKSPWVKAEANRGAKGNRLLPILIEDCTIPLRFEILQAADLIGWRGGADNGEWGKLLQKLGLLIPRRQKRSPKVEASKTTDAALHKVAAKIALALKAAGGALSTNKLFSVFREFEEFTTAQTTGQLWFGLGSKERLFLRLVELNPDLDTIRASDGGLQLTLKQALPAPEPKIGAVDSSQLPTTDKLLHTVLEVLHGAPLPVPLSHVAMVIEAEYGDGVRKSGWLGKRTLKQLILSIAPTGKLEISAPTGYLFDPARHNRPE